MFLQRARQSGRMPGGGGAGLAGSGLLIALVAGGLALNASLFNGAQLARVLLTVTENIFFVVDGGHRAIKYTRYAKAGFIMARVLPTTLFSGSMV